MSKAETARANHPAAQVVAPAPEFPKTLVNRQGVERLVGTPAQQIAAEYDGFYIK